MFSTIHQRDELSYRSWIRRMHKHKRAILGTSQRKIPDNKDAINLAKRLRDWSEEYFLFIRAGLSPTNNLAEQTIRQVVLDRRITQGTRSEKGNFWHERFWSVITTCKQQKKNVMTFLQSCVASFLKGLPPPNILQK
ncbi:MAG: transposase [Planctomycetaceae bacterium]|jgi:hypothetical protein|nr:transposase [Planctomycetaceae bacterium]